MKNKKTIKILTILLLPFIIISCGTEKAEKNNTNITNKNVSTENKNINTTENAQKMSSNDIENGNVIEYNTWTTEALKSEENSEKITNSYNNIKQEWEIEYKEWWDIKLENKNILISWKWVYNISWEISNWMITVDIWEKEEITLNLSNVNVSNNTWTALYIKSWKATINLVENTTNTFSDWVNYSDTSDKAPNATIVSVEDLVIDGNWSLIINGNYNDWINTKDDIKILNWNITINAKDDGIRWKDSINIENWIININSWWDGLKSDNETKWYITINNWDINISAWSDGMEAYNKLVINNGNINISKSVEWLESKVIEINNWNINIISSDDWINASDSSSTTKARPFEANDNLKIVINGWNVIVDSKADGIDSNGHIEMNWWTLKVYWPEDNWNAALDYDWTFKITNWNLVAFWSSWMAQNISDISTQNWILINLDKKQEAWVEFILKNINWDIIIKEKSKKSFSSVVISSPDIKNWKYTYEIWENKWEVEVSWIITNIWNVKWFWWFGWWNRTNNLMPPSSFEEKKKRRLNLE